MCYVKSSNVMLLTSTKRTKTKLTKIETKATINVAMISQQLARFIFSIYIFFTLFGCVVGREPIRAPDDVADILKSAAEVGSNILGIPLPSDDGPPCSIDIQRDLPKPNLPQPLYLQPGTTQWWLPNDNGIIEVPRGRSIELYCSSSYANLTDQSATTKKSIPYRTRTIRPICLQGKTFALNGEKYEFRHFACARQEKYTAERLTPQQRCANNAGQLYRIGYNLTATSGRGFLETMQICHDDEELRTYYVRHYMDPRNLHSQRGVKRSGFSKAGHFAAHDMNSLYTMKNQQMQIAQLLGEDEPYLTAKSHYLSRGHLAAKSDMIYASQQRTTFNFFNVAPQWQSFNSGQWATLENKVRAFVARAKLEVICYTGTWGTMQLGAANGTLRQPFYLTTDKNNNGLLPVPALYYRVIVVERRGGVRERDAVPKLGIALVGVNNPHATLAEILSEYVLCEDVREQVPWLSWMQNREENLKKGYLYACRVDEFVKVVATLPAELANVTDLLV